MPIENVASNKTQPSLEAPASVPRPEPGAHAKTMAMDAIPERETGPISEKQIRVSEKTVKSPEAGQEQQAPNPEKNAEAGKAAKREKFRLAHDVLQQIEADEAAETTAKLAALHKELGITDKDVDAAFDDIAPGERKIDDDFSAHKGTEIAEGAYAGGGKHVVFETDKASSQIALNLIKGKGVTRWAQELNKLKGNVDEAFYNEVAGVIEQAKKNMVARPAFLTKLKSVLTEAGEGQTSIDALDEALKISMDQNPLISPQETLLSLEKDPALADAVQAFKANVNKSRDRQSAA